jgi:hypothetical protein
MHPYRAAALQSPSRLGINNFAAVVVDHNRPVIHSSQNFTPTTPAFTYFPVAVGPKTRVRADKSAPRHILGGAANSKPSIQSTPGAAV